LPTELLLRVVVVVDATFLVTDYKPAVTVVELQE
jgi:hypothetical protein